MRATNHNLIRLFLIAAGAAGLLIGNDAPIEQVEVTHTEHLDFPSGGVLHLEKSIGDLSVEAWDQPGIELTTVKSTKSYYVHDRTAAAQELDSRIRVTTERQGNELTIATEFPKHPLLLRPFEGESSYEMQYRLKVPAGAKLVIDHQSGNVYISDILGDIHVTAGIGQIVIHLPENGRYAFNTKSDNGSVESDFKGHEAETLLLGRSFVSEESPAHAQKIYARIKSGDITILKTRNPDLETPAK